MDPTKNVMAFHAIGYQQHSNEIINTEMGEMLAEGC